MATAPHLRNSRTKFNRPYSEAELALFAQYGEQRRAQAPAACDGGAVCWVLQGPPALASKPSAPIYCAGCLSNVPGHLRT